MKLIDLKSNELAFACLMSSSENIKSLYIIEIVYVTLTVQNHNIINEWYKEWTESSQYD